jgi:hypothetical protein
MKVYSAAEAVYPAAERAYDYLFQNFKAETFFKLAAVATLCEGFVVSLQFVIPNAMPAEAEAFRLRSYLLAPDFLPVTLLAAAAVFLALVYCFYLVTRLRFAFFHSLIHQTRAMRPAWKLYSVEAERLFTASVLVWLCFLVAAVLAFVGVIVAAYGVVATPTADGKLDPGHFLILFFPCLFIGIGLIFAVFIAQVVLNDFILPHMAIESVSFKTGWAAVRVRMAANKETFTSYFILRMGMPLLAGLLLALVGWLLGMLIFGILGISAAGFDALLDGSGSFREHLRICVEWLFVALGMGAGVAMTISLGGPLGVFMRTYALLFYGGHYKALGNLLDPPRV